ncbi:MAG: ribosome small subunit-dependent GTPase A [Oscillospiraceae bacterium]|jgi:ribosome biogenesis GTPase
MTLKSGVIVKSVGGLYMVQTPDGAFECKARGIFRNRDISPCCGDRVEIEFDASGSVISKICERKNYIIRPPLSNLDQLVYVASITQPNPNLLLIDKFIAISEYKGIEPVLVITKIDLSIYEDILKIYRKTGITVFAVNNMTGEGTNTVLDMLKGKLSAFTGNTGVGKSTLLNNILPEAAIETGEISRKLGRGRHTTRHVELYRLDENSYVADTPGFSTFDTQKYDTIFKEDLALCFREFSDYSGKCKYQDCSHTKEKGCAVIEAVLSGEIPKSRHDSYVQMYEEAKLIKEWEHKKL